MSDQEMKIDQVLRSHRKSISLELKRDGRLIVRAPYLATRGQIELLVKSKERWIRSKRAILNQQMLASPPRKFRPGEQFLYLGQPFPLEIVTEQKKPLVLEDKFYLAARCQENPRPAFKDWYRKQAGLVIRETASLLASQHGFKYERIWITAAKTRWGSCGPKGTLNFTWRLVMAPEQVVTYVVTHELVHLRIRNHSSLFWQEVEKILPDYRAERTWLKDNGYLLSLE